MAETLKETVIVPVENTATATKDTLWHGVAKLKSTSQHCGEYFCRLFACVFCSTICCGLWIAFMYAIPIAAVTIGAIFLDDCTIERFIPIYLIVFGAIGIAVALANTVQQIFHSHESGDKHNTMWVARWAMHPQGTILGLFLFAWFIAGSVWIYRAHSDVDFDLTASPFYCHMTLYLFAFWVQTVIYILLAILAIIAISLFIIMCCTHRLDSYTGDEEPTTEATEME